MEIEDRIVDGMRESLVLASRVSEILFLLFLHLVREKIRF